MQRLEDASAGLVFDPVPHTYSLHGREMRSVSSIVKDFTTFDKEERAKSASANPKHEFYGVDPQEIIRIWEERGQEAADAGTATHEFGEACCLYLLDREEEIPERFRGRITPDGLVAIDAKEVACAQWWASTDWGNCAVVAKETRIVNPALGYAGTFDLLLYDFGCNGFRIKDYKTNKDLHKWFGNYLRPPLSVLKENDIGKYTVQQSLYAIALANIGIQTESMDLVWLRENRCCQEVRLDGSYIRLVDYAVRASYQNQNS